MPIRTRYRAHARGYTIKKYLSCYRFAAKKVTPSPEEEEEEVRLLRCVNGILSENCKLPFTSLRVPGRSLVKKRATYLPRRFTFYECWSARGGGSNRCLPLRSPPKSHVRDLLGDEATEKLDIFCGFGVFGVRNIEDCHVRARVCLFIRQRCGNRPI